MKKLKHITFITFLIITFSCQQNNESSETKITSVENKDSLVTSQFKVWGNCGMCKETIESSLKTDGISLADWDVDKKIITVQYNPSKISLDQIQKQIASVGYDNEKYRGNDSAYAELHSCCQYYRKDD